VIEHVPSPLDLLSAVRAALINAPAAAIFFETPDVDWILEGTVIQDFFYEHCSYFTPYSLQFAFQRAGFSEIDVEHLFGGQYLWLMGKFVRGTEVRSVVAASAARTFERARGFGRRATNRAAQIRARILAFRERGPVAVWGAGAKGVTFLNQLDPDGTLIDCVVDINPRKQSRFVPGTAHPIISVPELVVRDVANIVAMNPNYVDEIRADVIALGGHIEVVAESAL
jgi:hypothetical protein